MNVCQTPAESSLKKSKDVYTIYVAVMLQKQRNLELRFVYDPRIYDSDEPQLHDQTLPERQGFRTVAPLLSTVAQKDERKFNMLRKTMSADKLDSVMAAFESAMGDATKATQIRNKLRTGLASTRDGVSIAL